MMCVDSLTACSARSEQQTLSGCRTCLYARLLHFYFWLGRLFQTRLGALCFTVPVSDQLAVRKSNS